jgi:hypothetical protein
MISGHFSSSLSRRQYASQVVFAFCPERFGDPPKLCDKCGGDTFEHGICNNLLLSGRQLNICLDIGFECTGYYCKCSHDGEDHNPQVTSTTVVNGQTGTVIWEPTTLAFYTKLRASTTVTFTEAATTSDGGNGLETAVAVIFAGGIAWWAACKYIIP